MEVESSSMSSTTEPADNSDEDSSSLSGSQSDSTDSYEEQEAPEGPDPAPEVEAPAPEVEDPRRHRRLSRRADSGCPICGVTVRLPELRAHLAHEIDRLHAVARKKPPRRREESRTKQTFERVKRNRESRLTAKMAAYKSRARSEVQCPVCSLRILGDQDDVDRHVVRCLSHIQSYDTDEELVVDGDESFEEYQIGDQTRTRAISLVPGGHRALNGETITRTTEDEDLNVDIDDTLAYGKPQYTELDVIPCAISEREDKEREQLRKAVVLDPTVQPQILESRKWSNCEEKPPERREDSIYDDIIAINSHSDHIIASLKEKIKDLEEQNRNSKCLICMETYTKPVVSIACWHVYCEECWLMTMGVKKLCPQCNMIVFPSDLRRIYL